MIFGVIAIICAVIFITGIARIISRKVPHKPKPQEAKQMPFYGNPELMDYIKRNGGFR